MDDWFPLKLIQSLQLLNIHLEIVVEFHQLLLVIGIKIDLSFDHIGLGFLLRLVIGQSFHPQIFLILKLEHGHLHIDFSQNDLALKILSTNVRHRFLDVFYFAQFLVPEQVIVASLLSFFQYSSCFPHSFSSISCYQISLMFIVYTFSQ